MRNNRNNALFPYIRVGCVKKSRGLEGEVIVSDNDGLIAYLCEGLHVWITPPQNDCPRQGFISHVKEINEYDCLVRIDSITSAQDAKTIQCCSLIAKRKDIDYQENEYKHIFLNRRILDERYGEIGEVEDILEGPANACVVINGKYGEVLLSINPETIIEIPDNSDSPILVCVPNGTIPENI